MTLELRALGRLRPHNFRTVPHRLSQPTEKVGIVRNLFWRSSVDQGVGRGRIAGIFALAALGLGLTACEHPYLTNDGMLVFSENGGGRGASVLTANGIEYRDVTDIPEKVVRRDPREPWRAPLGFIVPSDGRFEKTSAPTIIAAKNLTVVMRPSDTRVPSWGGEVLVRVDVIAPASENNARFGEDVAIIVDADSELTLAVVSAALDRLSARDRVLIVDARGARVIVPRMPASDRELVVGALRRRLSEKNRPKADAARAVDIAATMLSSPVEKRMVLLFDRAAANGGSFDSAALERAGARGITVRALAVDAEYATDQIADLLPASGDVAFTDMRIGFEGTPAPSHVLEASGGDVVWKLEAGEVWFPEIRAGESRTEVVRVSVPAWQPGSPFTFTVNLHADDAKTGRPLDVPAHIECIYDDDIERIAKSRHGDVIAYASALATLKKLDLSFNRDGAVASQSLRSIALLHARSMAALAYDLHDPAMQHQADMLSALLAVTK